MLTAVTSLPRRHRSAWIGVVFGCIGVVLGAAIPAILADPDAAIDAHLWEAVLAVLTWSGLCLLLAARAPLSATVFVRVFGAVAAGGALTLALQSYAQFGFESGWSGAAVAAWAAGWTWIIAGALPVTLLLLWFPDGRPGSRTSTAVEGAVVVGILAAALGLATEDAVFLSADNAVPNPLAWGASAPFLLIGILLLLAAGLVALSMLVGRFRRSGGERRRQIAPVMVAALVEILALVLAIALPDWGPMAQMIAAPLLPCAVTVAILRFRLFDVELLVRRSVVFVGLSVFIFVGYAVVTATTSALVNRGLGVVSALIATALLAAAFDPLRRWLQGVVSRGLYGERDSPHRALAAVSGQLAAAADPEVALTAATDQVRRTLRLPWVTVTAGGVAIATSGARAEWITDAMLRRVPLVHLGVQNGFIVVADRAPRDPLSRADRRLLEELASLLAAVVAAGRSTDELRRSREQLVRSREEERRTLRRDLHDDLGPLLSAIVTQADVVSLRLERAPETAGELVGRLKSTSAVAVETLRRVVDDLHPAAISAFGLDTAVRDLVEALTVDSGCSASVDIRRSVDLDPAMELVLFRILGESVTNALRHGRPSAIRILLSSTDVDTVLVITDDGGGFEVRAPTSGIGLVSMNERVRELGGSLSIRSDPTGTRVTATLPGSAEVSVPTAGLE